MVKGLFLLVDGRSIGVVYLQPEADSQKPVAKNQN